MKNSSIGPSKKNVRKLCLLKLRKSPEQPPTLDLGMVAVILTNLVVGIGLTIALPSYHNEPKVKILRGPQGGFNGSVGYSQT